MLHHKAVRLLSKHRSVLIASIGEAVRAFQEATDDFDNAACRVLGLNRTDLRCLGIVAQKGRVSVGAIGTALKLTRGATTTAVDRVERTGYVTRVPDPNDRRGVLIEMTESGLAAVSAVWTPMVTEGEQILASYPDAALEAIVDFLTRARMLQLKHSRR